MDSGKSSPPVWEGLNEADLTMPRAKPRSLSISLAYRAKRLAQKVFGPRRLLRFCLNASWLLRRFAHELNADAVAVIPPTGSSERALAIIRQWLPPHGSVLDIGCGVGHWCRLVAPYAASVVGIDYSAESLERARKMTSDSNVEYRLGDVTKDLTDERFDVALLFHVIEHIDDVDALLQPLHRLASTLVVGVPDFESDHLNAVRLRLGCPYYSDADHVREYTQNLLQHHLERNGWHVQLGESRNGTAMAVATHDPLAAVEGNRGKTRFTVA
jgi:SAM-dependent methyltransferase